jgi:hypothetical protein
MRSIRKTLALFGLALITQCQSKKDTNFLITSDKVGKLERNSWTRDLDLIFAEDSLVMDTVQMNFGNMASKIRIFEKGGAHLLTLTPNKDSIPKVENVFVQDDRFVTDKGININSTFKDIQEAYTIKKIITSLNNVIILIKDSNVYFTIDKSQLPENLRYNANNNIEAVQIPDAAKIKYLMVGWD